MQVETPISELTDEEIKQELKEYGIKFHHKTGSSKLAELLYTARENPEVMVQDIPVAVDDRPYEGGLPDASEAAKAAAAKALTKTGEKEAMKLVRIVVTPNDPLMSSYPGLIFTVGASGLNGGKMIKKYVPFNNEEGWHVPQVILNQIEYAEMQKFKTVTMPNGEKQLEPYITKKFNVRILDPLTKEELERLAASQAANPAFHQGS
tara:strand:+ start:579 stop:1196 length:618 start_codon:yes stop_codon:yes gene_type:complete